MNSFGGSFSMSMILVGVVVVALFGFFIYGFITGGDK